MPTKNKRWAADTSVAVPALDSGHAAHQICKDLVRNRRPALAGHASFETYSVLTRMPGALAVDGPTAASIIRRTFPTFVGLNADAAGELFDRIADIGITGGAVYDALVGESARLSQRTLLSRDLRARRTYDLLGIDYELVGL